MDSRSNYLNKQCFLEVPNLPVSVCSMYVLVCFAYWTLLSEISVTKRRGVDILNGSMEVMLVSVKKYSLVAIEAR